MELTEGSRLNATISALSVCEMFIDYLQATPAQILLFSTGYKKEIRNKHISSQLMRIP